MATAHVNIGSNIGDRRALIARAVACIGQTFDTVPRCSRLFESKPWGFESENDFLNLGMNIEVGTLSAEDVFIRLSEVQRSLDNHPHRNVSGEYADRYIDIDLIAVDNIVLCSPDLMLPHPRMHLREFVLAPMAEIWPEWRHPISGLTPLQMLGSLLSAG